MIVPNKHYSDLKDSYLFYNIAQKTKTYLEKNPDKRLYRMGIGDVSLPLCDAVIKALENTGAKVYETRNGQVDCSSDGKTISVTQLPPK